MKPENFVYLKAEQTDVQLTWRRFGWVPPSEKRGESKPVDSKPGEVQDAHITPMKSPV